jgi:hypothetical protein
MKPEMASIGWNGSLSLLLTFVILLSVVFIVVAQSKSPPVLGLPELLTNGVVQFRIFGGEAGQTNVVEASTNLIDWTPVSTNVFPPTLCPICPFILFEDSVTNSAARFYRSRNFP